MKIIVGLGNPGKEYALTKHNIGFMLIDKLMEIHGIPCTKKYLYSLIGEGFIGEEKVILAKPQRFINLSGLTVKAIINEYKCSLDSIIIICDDINLPIGKIRIRRGGSSGGHNGIKSIASHLGSLEFPRLRIGIGINENLDIRDYVLSPFNRDDLCYIEVALSIGCSAIETWVKEGIDNCMNKYN